MTTSLSYQLSFNEFHSFQRKVSVAQSYPTLCNPMDCSPPGSSVHGILQTRMLEWVAVSSPRDLPNLGIKPGCPELKADSLPPEPLIKPTISKERFKCIALISFYFQPTFATIISSLHLICQTTTRIGLVSTLAETSTLMILLITAPYSNANSSTKYVFALLYRGYPQRTSLPLLFGNSLQYL